MSASREKKIRQEKVAQGYVDPKVIREAEEKAAQKKSKLAYGIIAALFVIVAVVSLLINSGILERNAKAVSIDGEEYTAAEMSYYYYSIYNNVVNSQYAAYLSLDTAQPLDQQVVSDTAKLVLGIDDPAEMTWQEYLMQTTKDSMVSVKRMYEAAIAEGEDPKDEHVTAEIDSTLEMIGQYAKQSGYTTKEYLRLVYGKNMTVDLYREIATKAHVASHFENEYIAALTYTESDMEAYYAAHKSDFDVVAYESLAFAGTPEVKRDAEDKVIEATDEEKAEAKKAAAETAAAVLERVQKGESLADIAKEYEGKATYVNSANGANVGTAMTDWLFESKRVDGDATVIAGDPASTVVIFHSVGRHDYKTVDVRHILATPDTTALDTESETYEADKQAAWDAAKAEAEQILADWKAGAATEESFGEMAAQLSDDSAVNGLYEQVYKGRMVAPFENWCFDAARKSGDTGIVETNYGYHVMYFVAQNAPYWQIQVEAAMANEDYNAWYEEMVSGAEVVELSGIKHVG